MRLLQAFLQRYASAEARALLSWVRGPRLLDLGAGEGWVAEALRSRAPVWACDADVGPFGLAAEMA
jgi:2-polyprenyl-3-methyl-5-hydroxy-6-metoxy-1,4-benzoquinol methylase